jgi:hypothetical protein
MRLLRQAAVVLVFCGWFAGRVAAQEKFTTPLIPREVLFGNPERADSQISPDGMHCGVAGRTNFATIRLIGGSANNVVSATASLIGREIPAIGLGRSSKISLHRRIVCRPVA